MGAAPDIGQQLEDDFVSGVAFAFKAAGDGGAEVAFFGHIAQPQRDHVLLVNLWPKFLPHLRVGQRVGVIVTVGDARSARGEVVPEVADHYEVLLGRVGLRCVRGSEARWPEREKL